MSLGLANASFAPKDATYLVQTASGILSNEQALSTLSTGIVKVTTGTGVFSTAVSGVDYFQPGGTDLSVSDGGTGVSSLTAYAPLFGGTSSTNPVQSGTVGTSGQLLVSNGAGSLPTFQTIGYEVTANKSTDTTFASPDNTTYPTTLAIKTYADGLVVGLLDDRGSYDASGNVFPSTGGSGVAGAIMKGDIWYISVGGTLGGTTVAIGDSVRALVNTPGQTAANWSVLESNIGYVPENVANKSTDGTLAANSTTLYPSQSAVKTYADTKSPAAGSASIVTTGTVTSGVWHSERRMRIQTTASTSTITANWDADDQVNVTALAAAMQFANPSGSATEGQKMMWRVKDNGTARALTYDTQFRAVGVTLPTTTVISKTVYIGGVWNGADSKVDVLAVAQEA
jgi:hypothetical protein